MGLKKKILVVTQYYYPEQFRINDMTSEWVARGYDVTVLTGIPNYPMGKFFEGYSWLKKRRETIDGVKIIRIPIIPRGNSAIGMVMNYISFVISGYIWAKSTKTEVDYVFNFEVSPMTQALPAIWYAKQKKIPCDIYVQDLWPENVQIITGINSTFVINPINKMVDYIYKNVSRIFTTSPSFVEAIKDRVDDPSKVHYWPQYAEDFYKPLTKTRDKQVRCLDIVFTGNIGKAQGLDILPKAAEILKDRYPEYEISFNIVGDGRYQDDLIALIGKIGVDSYFVFHGRKPSLEIPKYIAENDVAFISFADNPLFAKTIPAKLQSYMACGIPILAAASGETVRIIKESNAGYFGGTSDINQLVENIICLANKGRMEISELGNNSRQYFLKCFTKKMLMDEMDRYISLSIDYD